MKPMRFIDVVGDKICDLIDCPNLPSKDDIVMIWDIRYIVLAIQWEAMQTADGLLMVPTDVVVNRI